MYSLSRKVMIKGENQKKRKDCVKGRFFTTFFPDYINNFTAYKGKEFGKIHYFCCALNFGQKKQIRVLGGNGP